MSKEELICRANNIGDGQPVEGYYVFCRGRHYILPLHNEAIGFDERWIQAGADDESGWFEINPETLKHYVCPDKNGKPVYAGDKVKAFFRPSERCAGDPEYDTGSFWWDVQDLLWRIAIKGDRYTKKRYCVFYDFVELIQEDSK